MENASKALILAGSVLIAIIIISLGIMVFNNMSNSVKNESTLTKQQISSFNSKISPYIGESISGSQVNELMQRIRSINQKADSTEDNIRKVSVKYNGVEGVTSVVTGKYYSVQGSYDSNGLLTIITVQGPK